VAGLGTKVYGVGLVCPSADIGCCWSWVCFAGLLVQWMMGLPVGPCSSVFVQQWNLNTGFDSVAVGCAVVLGVGSSVVLIRVLGLDLDPRFTLVGHGGAG